MPQSQQTHTVEAENHANPGAVPDAHLLLYNSVLVVAALVAFSMTATRKLAAVPRGVQNVAEALADGLNGLTVTIIGPDGDRYTPFVGTLFIYILLMNLLGLIPGLHSPTSNWTFTIALGIVVFAYSLYENIRINGFWGYLKHLAGPIWYLAWLIGPIELMSEFIRPITLSVRLFGNIFGEDVVIIILAGLGAASLATRWIPIQFPVTLLSILTGIVQAGVFAILAAIYLSLAQRHGHEEGSDTHGHEAAMQEA